MIGDTILQLFLIIIFCLSVFSKFSVMKRLKHYFYKVKNFNNDNSHWNSFWQQANQVTHEP